MNKSASLSARKLEVKGNIKSKKEQAILTHRKSVGNHRQKYDPKRKEDMHVSELLSFYRCAHLTEGEDWDNGFHPLGDLGVVSHIDHHFHVREAIDDPQKEVLNSTASVEKRHMAKSYKEKAESCSLLQAFLSVREQKRWRA